MAKSGQHHNDGLSSAKPRGHESARGRNRPDRSQEITTGSYKKRSTYERQAAEHSGNTSDAPAQSPNRDSSIHGDRSGSDSNADRGTRGH